MFILQESRKCFYYRFHHFALILAISIYFWWSDGSILYLSPLSRANDRIPYSERWSFLTICSFVYFFAIKLVSHIYFICNDEYSWCWSRWAIRIGAETKNFTVTNQLNTILYHNNFFYASFQNTITQQYFVVHTYDYLT